MLTPEQIARIRQIELRSRFLVEDSFAGEYHSVFKGRGMEFDEVRPYQPGDDTRTIDWNVTARMNAPFTKHYIEAREFTVILAVDASASGEFGSVGRFKRDLAAELAAILALAAERNNDKVGLLVFTDQIEQIVPPRSAHRHIMRIVRDILVFQPESAGTDLALALRTLNRICKRRSIIFLISDFYQESSTFWSALLAASRRHDLIAIDLEDPLDRVIADVGLVALEDPESGQVCWVDTGNQAWRRHFAAQTARRSAEKLALFAKAGVDRISIETGQDYVPDLTRFFQRRHRRKIPRRTRTAP